MNGGHRDKRAKHFKAKPNSSEARTKASLHRALATIDKKEKELAALNQQISELRANQLKHLTTIDRLLTKIETKQAEQTQELKANGN